MDEARTIQSGIQVEPGGRGQVDAYFLAAVRTAIDRPLGRCPGQTRTRLLRGGEMFGMDHMQHAPVDRAYQDPHALVSDKGAVQDLEARRRPRARTGVLQGVADERELAVQFMCVQLLEVRVQHAPEQHGRQHEQARGQRGEQGGEAGGQ